MKLLALSTSTHRGSAAVLEGDRVLGQSGYTDLAGHAERIFSAVTAALDAAATKRSEIGLVVCDMGPGSFTGVRVGVASAKGLALGLGVPLVGVGSLEAMAAAAFATGLAEPSDVVVAVLDAKKQEFFLAAYDASGQALQGPVHVPIVDASRIVNTHVEAMSQQGARVRIVGEAALLEPSLGCGLESAGREAQAHLVRGSAVDLPDAVAIGRLGWQRFASSASAQGAFDPAALEPSYVRPPDAKPMASTGAT